MIYLISFCGHTNDQRHLQFYKYKEDQILDSTKLGVEVAHGMRADFLSHIPSMFEDMRMGCSDRHYSPSSVLTYRVTEDVYMRANHMECNEDEYDEEGNRINQGYNLDHDDVWDLVQQYVDAAKSGVNIETIDY